MKKVKFTLGLMLAILFLGSSVADAQLAYRRDLAETKTQAAVGYSISVKSNPHFNLIESKWRDYSWENSYMSVVKPDGVFELGIITGWPGLGITEDIRKEDYSKAIFNNNVGTAGNHLRYETTGAVSIFKIEKEGWDFHNDIIIELNYKNGNELIPVVKRTIVYGKWGWRDGNNNGQYNPDRADEYNTIYTTNVGYDDYLQADSVTFRPDLDRNSGVARYVFSQDILELAKKYPIYSISYEISVHDEIGNIGHEAYEPPMMGEPEHTRGLTFEVGSGLTTSIPMKPNFDNILYVPSYKNYVFTVFSTEEIEVITNRKDGVYSNDGVKVEKDKEQAGAYKVTIQKVQSNFNVKVALKSDLQSTGGENGQTGNAGPTGDAVWASAGTLYVNAATPGLINIYSVTGQLIRTEAISGSYTLSLPKGLYLVQLNGKTYKVIP